MLCRVHFLLIASSLVSLVRGDQHIVISAEAEIYDPDKPHAAACGQNETYSRCDANPSCQKNCDNVDTWDTSPCLKTKDCISGCVCKGGFVRYEHEGVCVWENSCPRVRH